MPDPTPEPPAPLPNPTPGSTTGTATISTSLLGDLQVPGSPEQAATIQALAARAAVYATLARGDGTRRTYRSAWRAYEAWCSSLGRPPLAGDTFTAPLSRPIPTPEGDQRPAARHATRSTGLRPARQHVASSPTDGGSANPRPRPQTGQLQRRSPTGF